MIMGLEQPDGGELVIGQTVVPMYVDQSREGLDNDRTVSGPPPPVCLQVPPTCMPACRVLAYMMRR